MDNVNIMVSELTDILPVALIWQSAAGIAFTIVEHFR
jgi:hypothetical protein